MTHFKDIYVLPHSHFDYGYTHPQRMLLELQTDYLTDAIELCLETRDNPEGEQFKWTIEANWILSEWLKDATADQLERLKRCLDEGRIAIAAMAYHTTPLADIGEQVDLLRDMPAIENKLDYKIRTAINHDINGQPWSIPQLLQQVGVDFYLTGINIHYGAIPFERPTVFRWAGPDDASVTSFLGEHYSLFSQFPHSERFSNLFEQGASDQAIFKSMREELDTYEAALAKRSWEQPFYVLTATNPPLYDNNGPDRFLTRAVQAYNNASPDQKIHIITVDQLRIIVNKSFMAKHLPVHRGDWTDYWNFGAGSTPAETRIHKHIQTMIRATDCLNTIAPPKEKTLRTLTEARELNRLFGEHTWGASEAITDPSIDMTKSQRVHKDHLAWDASALASYALGTAVETANGDPGDFALSAKDAIVSVYNPTPYRYKGPVDLPLLEASLEDSSLAALRIKDRLPYETAHHKPTLDVDIPAFSRQLLPLRLLLETSGETASADADFRLDTDEGRLITPHYELDFDPKSGTISTLRHRQSGRTIDGGRYGFASVIREQLDPSEANHRSTFFPRDVMLGNLGVPVWNRNWRADRAGFEEIDSVKLTIEPGRAVFTRRWQNQIGLEWLSLDLVFWRDRDLIELDLRMDVSSPTTPVSYYLSFPTDAGEGWVGRFDTAGVPVRLDMDQIGTVSKDWITVDNYYAVHDEQRGVYIATPDARLLAPSGFGFSRLSPELERQAQPLVLAWLCNNYWDTNFAASFTGLLTYRFAYQPFEQFNPLEAASLGSYTARPVIASVARAANIEGEKTWYQFESQTAAIQFIRPQPEGILLAIRNLDHENLGSARFALTEGEIRAAEAINLLGEIQGEIKLTESNAITLEMGKGQLLFLRLTIEKS